MSRAEVLASYERYLGAVNGRRWDEVGAAVADRVLVNDVSRTRREYVDDLRRVVAAFPDYTWTLRRVLVEEPWLAVQLADRGTRRATYLGAPGDGTVVRTDEFAMYRLVAGLVVEVHVAADDLRLTARPGSAG